MPYTVKQAAGLAGVSVRTLHHYDHIGLLVPSSRSTAGYRLYGEADLARLQQILFFRELGFELEAIGPILNAPEFDREAALRTHRRFIEAEARRLATLLETLDHTIASLERKVPMETKDMFAGFDPSERAQLAEWQAEARERWGHTDAWRESQARTSGYTAADWEAIKQESKAIDEGLAELMDRDPADPAVQALVERAYRQINERFYECPIEMFRGLSDMWVNDGRFTKNIDQTRQGLAAFKREAVHVFCDNHRVVP